LDPLVQYITDAAPESGRVSSEIDTLPIFKSAYPNHLLYVDEIASEIQRFGGNSIANLARGGKGVLYKEVATDVAAQLKVKCNPEWDIATIEGQILLAVLSNAWEKMTPEQKTEFMRIVGEQHTKSPTSFPFATAQIAIRIGGFAAYQLGAIVANAIARALLGRGLSAAANAGLSRAIGLFAGPVGLAITALWTVIDLAGPAYRVTVPCVLHVASVRQAHAMRLCPTGHINGPGAKFCDQCGAPVAP
jgi:uncharacterized protein YaaW (UPF0174 family)